MIKIVLIAISWILGTIAMIATLLAGIVVMAFANLALSYLNFFLGILLCPVLIIGLIIFSIFGGSLASNTSSTNTNDNRLPESDFYSGAEVTDTWRSRHPYGYNPFTGGSNAEEDAANGR